MHPACAHYACPGCVADSQRRVYNLLNWRNPHEYYCDVCENDKVGLIKKRTSNALRKFRLTAAGYHSSQRA
ncbi:hypothetical protein NCC49_006240 [Naganishia albida]|nr:hypothetical protein NCC49_006240 [Naganishia albida]